MKKTKGGRSLQELIDGLDDLVDYFYNDTVHPWQAARLKHLGRFVPPEQSTWADEQRAWRHHAMLFDLSHHMPELYLSGPDAHRLLAKLSMNDLSNLDPGRAKQFIACAPSGYVIGDCICYCHGENDFELVSGMYVQNWVQYNAEVDNYDVSIRREQPTPYEPGPRSRYRFQLEGPNAAKIFDELVEGETPDVPFFRTAKVRIAGLDVLVLRHGMAGHMGAEFSGPYEEMEAFRSAVLAVGRGHGLLEGGTKAYFSANLESGWVPYPTPAVFVGEELRGFREWLSDESWEAQQMFGGSFKSCSVEDYFVTPWDLGYGHLLKFRHEFVGREALEALAEKPKRTKVTLVWNPEDVGTILTSILGDGPKYKNLELPVGYYGYPQLDRVTSRDGEVIGISTQVGYTANDHEVLSLAMIDEDQAEAGSEVVVIWGEPDGGSRKPFVEKGHAQMRVRATIAPCPYAAVARHRREQKA